MARTPVWQAIAETLHSDIAEGRYGPGDRLPTEAELSARFGVNRHTVRRALAKLIDDQVIYSRRGAGSFVLSRPTDYPLGRRVRFHQNLLAAGRRPDRKILSVGSRAATPDEADRLNVATGSSICDFHGISLADGQPLAVFHSLFPESRLSGIAEALQKEKSVTRALAAIGVTDYTRSTTRLQARSADATQAIHLRLREGAPLLYSSSVNVDGAGQVVEFGKTWFAGDRITLTLEQDQLDTDLTC